jgi:hypothetical protein
MKKLVFALCGILMFSLSQVQAGGKSESELAEHFRNEFQVEKLFVTIDNQKNILVTGFFSDTVAIESHILESQGILDIFIAKYDRNMDLVWVKHAGGSNIDFSKFINTDKYDNIYIQGLYKGKAYFEGYHLDSKGTYDYFTAKYSYTGELLWVKTRKGSAIVKQPNTNKGLWFSKR